MYLFTSVRPTAGKNRKRCKRKKAAWKAKQRRRYNGMVGRKLGRKLGRVGTKKRK